MIDSSTNGWIAGQNHTYYYPHPVDSESVTEMLCEPIALEQIRLDDGTTAYQVLEVIGEAVQAEPFSVTQEAWGVTVANNEIIAVS